MSRRPLRSEQQEAARAILADSRREYDAAEEAVDRATQDGAARLARIVDARKTGKGAGTAHPWLVEAETAAKVTEAKRLAFIAEVRLDGATRAIERMGLA